MLVIAQIQSITNNLQRLLGKVKVTDGTHDMPAMDDPGRAGWIQEKQNAPTASGRNNPSLSLSWSDGELTQIDMGMNGSTYRKTLSWTDGEPTGISSWSEV